MTFKIVLKPISSSISLKVSNMHLSFYHNTVLVLWGRVGTIQ